MRLTAFPYFLVNCDFLPQVSLYLSLEAISNSLSSRQEPHGAGGVAHRKRSSPQVGASQPGLPAPATPAGKCTPHGQGGVTNHVAQAFRGAQARVPP